MSDIHALSGAFAIDALDDIERAQFARHLSQCPECSAEVESLREAAALLPATVATAPSDALRARILTEIATFRPLPPLTATPIARSGRRFRPVALVAAAAAVIALAGGVAVVQPWADETSQLPAAADQIDQVLQAADAETYTKELRNGATVTITRSASRHQAVLETSGLANLPSDQVYEMWFAHHDRGMVPAGLMESADGTFLMTGDAADAIGAGITVERAGGSEEPTLPAVTTFAFENA